jgi:hypothetical protein
VSQFTVPFKRFQQSECGFAINNSNIIFWEVDAKDFTFMSRPFERTTEKVRYALFEFHLACYDFPSRVDYDYVGCKE